MEAHDALHQRISVLECQMRRQRQILIAFALCVGALGGAALVQAPQKQRFTEIDVERINVIEPDGNLSLVLANTSRLPEPIVNGKVIKSVRTGPGILFFDGKGWEVGGVSYGNRKQGDNVIAGGQIAFDQYHNDQVVFMSYTDRPGTRRAGFFVTDRPTSPTLEELLQKRDAMAQATGEAKARLEAEMKQAAERGDLGVNRVFVGSENRTAQVDLKDTTGHSRIRMSVDGKNEARLEFLNEKGEVTYSIPK
jgi:hypothetical protein